MTTTITRRTELAHRTSDGLHVYLFAESPLAREVGDERDDGRPTSRRSSARRRSSVSAPSAANISTIESGRDPRTAARSAASSSVVDDGWQQ